MVAREALTNVSTRETVESLLARARTCLNSSLQPGGTLSLLWNGLQASAEATLSSVGVQNGDHIVVVESAVANPASARRLFDDVGAWCLRPAMAGAALQPGLTSALESAAAALAAGEVPHLAADGMGGTYFLPGLQPQPQQPDVNTTTEDTPAPTPPPPSGVHVDAAAVPKYVCCWKPRDEEIECPANPRGHGGAGLGLPLAARAGLYSGEQYAREVAAYLLDRLSGGIHGVPETCVAEGYHPGLCNVPHPGQHILRSTAGMAASSPLMHGLHAAAATPIEASASSSSSAAVVAGTEAADATVLPAPSPAPGLVPKLGSLQVFLDGVVSAEDRGHREFTDLEVQKVALLVGVWVR